MENVRKIILEENPAFFEILKKRHVRLKKLYAMSRKKYYKSFIKRKAQYENDSDSDCLHDRTATSYINNSKIGRNEPCPCGSGKKYKKCCLK